ncbi:protein phosphatase 1 regulatory inhibitor subunit 16B [Apiospora arundinis]
MADPAAQPPAQPSGQLEAHRLDFEEYFVGEYLGGCIEAINHALDLESTGLTPGMETLVEVGRAQMKYGDPLGRYKDRRLECVLFVRQKAENVDFKEEMRRLKENLTGRGKTFDVYGRETITDGFDIQFRVGKCLFCSSYYHISISRPLYKIAPANSPGKT